MAQFGRILMVDWSAAAKPTPARPSADAIWIARAGPAGPARWYCRTRSEAMFRIAAEIQAALTARDRCLVGFDFPFGYPAGFAKEVCGRASGLAVWGEIASRIEDADDNANNRFEVAAGLNRQFLGVGPFWGRPASLDLPDLPPRGTDRTGPGHPPERRLVEHRVPRAQPVWKLYTTGSVGSQALTGIARLQGLRTRYGSALSVWPFEPPDAPVVLAEVYPSLLADVVQRALERTPGQIKDAVQVRVLADALAALDRSGGLPAALAAAEGRHLAQEAWILGVGAEAALRDAALQAQSS